MKRIARLAVITLTLAPTCARFGAEQHTLTGEHHWNQIRDGGALEAVFTATGESAWAGTLKLRA